MLETSQPANGDVLGPLIGAHVASLAGRQFAATTVRARRKDLAQFAAWCAPLGLNDPRQLTLGVLERYQQLVSEVRKQDGEPLGWGGQAHKLTAVRQFLRWAARLKHVEYDAGAALELPRRPQQLPRTILSEREVERVLARPRLTDPMGIRDRAILETLYSTGMRRQELLQLTLPDIDEERGVVFIREGKGRKDRVVPIGPRALAWIARYQRKTRPRCAAAADSGVLFLTVRGRPMRDNRLTELVHRYIEQAGIGKTGSCHVFRHTMATLMLEGGADVRYIQAILGHAQLSTTALYTRVSIVQLKAVHQRTHPANRNGGGDKKRAR